MMNLEDKTIRQQLIQRYLDADTSIEEEKDLTHFYLHCDESELSKEELNFRNMILGISIAAQKEETKNKKAKSFTQWVRISAILLAAAMLAGLIFLLFPLKDKVAQKNSLANLVPTTQVIRSQQTQDGDENLSPAEQMERQDSLFMAATQGMATQKNVNKSISHKKVSSPAAPKQKMEAEKANSDNNTSETGSGFDQLYEIASLAIPSADQLKIDKQGSEIIISAIDEDGNSQHFSVNVDEAQDGVYQLHPLAQLDNPNN